MARTCARAASNPCDVSTRKSARARFSASGICFEQDRFELLQRHAGPLQHARALHVRRRRHHHHRVDPRIAAGLEQERNVEHRDRLAARLRLRQKFPLRLVHQRMHDRLQPPERIRIAQHARAELHAVDLAARHRAGKRRLDQRHRLAFVQTMHHRIGVMHRHARFGEEARGGGFAHSERAGQAEHEHCRILHDLQT